MSYGLCEKIERKMDCRFAGYKPWSRVRHSDKPLRKAKARAERHRVKRNVECQPLYKRFDGWEW